MTDKLFYTAIGIIVALALYGISGLVGIFLGIVIMLALSFAFYNR